jgi:hypothetical protein
VDRRSLLLGVRRIGFQRTGTLSAARAELERTRAFRRNANWRVGIEARISHLKRGLGCGAGRNSPAPGHHHNPQPHRPPDRAGLIDGLIITTGLGLLS